MRRIPFLYLATAALFAAAAGVQEFQSFNLPVLVLDTGGRAIPDAPRIPARLGVADGGPGRRISPQGPLEAFDGPILIERRGSSSRSFPKNNFAFETVDDQGGEKNVPLLGFPAEHDWVLHGPCSDKSLMRNALAYRLSNDVGRCASRSRFCGLVPIGRYRGVYPLLEKVKRDRNRVGVADLDSADADPTGGFIVKIDKTDGEENGGWVSPHPADAQYGRPALCRFHLPRPERLTAAQRAAVVSSLTALEDGFAASGPSGLDPSVGRRADPGTFMDPFLLGEFAKNADAYRLSFLLHKDRDGRDGRWRAGPPWDLNLGFGNADHYAGWRTGGWEIDFLTRDRAFRATDGLPVPFWWRRLRDDSLFRSPAAARWKERRAGPLAEGLVLARIDARADTHAEAQALNSERWPVLGAAVRLDAFVGDARAEELDHLRARVTERGAWMDRAAASLAGAGAERAVLLADHPNPFTRGTTVAFALSEACEVALEVFDAAGRPVRGRRFPADVPDQRLLERVGRGRNLAAGAYAVRFRAGLHAQSV